MTSPTCPLPLFPDKSNCSGTGVCVDETHCACPPGWSGSGDFVLGEPSCSIYLDAVKALWAVGLPFFLIVAMLGIANARKALSLVKPGESRFFNYYMWNAMSYFSSGVGFGGCAILKIIDPSTQIAQDAVVTVIFWFGYVGESILVVGSFIYLDSKKTKETDLLCVPIELVTEHSELELFIFLSWVL
jgi:hypothetical protein